MAYLPSGQATAQTTTPRTRTRQGQSDNHSSTRKPRARVPASLQTSVRHGSDMARIWLERARQERDASTRTRSCGSPAGMGAHLSSPRSSVPLPSASNLWKSSSISALVALSVSKL